MDSNDRTLWMGDIQLNWDEVYIGTLFTTAGREMTRNKLYLLFLS
jgi:hypothetical protein